VENSAVEDDEVVDDEDDEDEEEEDWYDVNGELLLPRRGMPLKASTTHIKNAHTSLRILRFQNWAFVKACSLAPV